MADINYKTDTILKRTVKISYPVEEIVPCIEKSFRVGKDHRDRVVWGSSLGGGVSFYSDWEYPKVFGACVCS